MASALTLFFHPLIVVLIENRIIALTAGFTPSHSSLRLIIFAFLIAYSCTGLAKYSNYTHTTSYFSGVLGGLYAICPLIYFDRLLVRQWEFADRRTIFPGQYPKNVEKRRQKRNDEYDQAAPDHLNRSPVMTEAGKDTFGYRFAFGNEIAGSGRMIDTPWEAKNVAPFSPSDPNYIPSRASIIARNVLNILTSLIVREFVEDVQMSIDPFYIAQSRVPFLTRLHEVTREEVAVRLVLGVSKWVYSYCMLQIAFGTGMTLLAFLKPDEVRKLRPGFGSLSEAYTVRGFWGKFWHQNLRNNFEGPSRLMTHKILRLPRGSLPARYSSIFFSFFLSGIIHIAIDIGMNVPPSQSGALRFFCTIAVGIMLEDGVQAIYRRLDGGKDPNKLWSKVLGYVWVVVFLSWSPACWLYPQLRITKWEDGLLQYGVLRSLLGLPKA